ncbi:hypothetical protein AGDE_12875 [Angomonas deanei]|nr:hypothetical protein AGDE_12875 [Angomonas deanei]|eukprot:EPY23351.1 hypothetical protein AGDE_12875 [Angomonas deanei]
MVPVIDFVCAGLLRILPLTLWQWLLVLCSSTFGLVVSLRAEPQGGYHKYTLFFAGVVFALLYNGFVVRRA